MKIIYTTLFLLLYANSFCQTQMMEGLFPNIEHINPASIGRLDQSNINLHVGTQWLTFGKEAPKVSILEYNKRVFSQKYGRRSSSRRNLVATPHGFGFHLLDEKLGIYNEWSLGGSYSYHVNLGSENYLSFGIRAHISNGSINLNDIVFQQNYDPLFMTMNQRTLKSNIDFGILLYKEKYRRGRSGRDYFNSYYLGFSLIRLFDNALYFQKDIENSLNRRTFNSAGGLSIPMNKKLSLSLSLSTCSTVSKFLSFYNFETSFEYMPQTYTNTNEDLLIRLGGEYSKYSIKTFLFFKLNNYSIKYSILQSNKEISSYNVISHTISLGYYID